MKKVEKSGVKVDPKNGLSVNNFTHQNLSKDDLAQLFLSTRDRESALMEKNKFLEYENKILKEEIQLLRRKLFDKAAEQYKEETQVFDEPKANPQDLEADQAISSASKELDEKTVDINAEEIEKIRKKPGRRPVPADYLRVDIIHDLNESEKVCSCGCALTQFGEEVSEQLDVIPAKVYVKRHRRLKYACKNCQENVKIAPVQNQAIAKCLAAPGLLAYTAILKYDDHLPLFRQSEVWDRLGIDISRSTLSSWILKIGNAVTPLIQEMRKHIVASNYVKADETTVQVLRTFDKSNTSKSFMWVYMTGKSDQPAVVYDYQESRKGAHAQSFLDGFKGVLQTDAYRGYDQLTSKEGVESQGCWAHARRKFFDTWSVCKKEGAASQSLAIIGKLYDIEREIIALPNAEKYKVRQEKSKPILEAFHTFLKDIQPNVQPKGLLHKAVQYTLNQWDALTLFLTDGKIDIDNNAAERAIRPFAVGRKNWMFMGSPNGATAAAYIYSLIESAKMNNLNPQGYLKYILEHKIDELDTELIQKLMPWNPDLKNVIDKDFTLPPAEIDTTDQKK
ncbi:MAG: hypothetical protein CNLJKLNK_01424 [Holosporales bacterium]